MLKAIAAFLNTEGGDLLIGVADDRKWKDLEATPAGDLFVRSGPGTVKLSPESAAEYIRTRFTLPPA